ncbi:MAG: hypothetical protein RLZZ326_449 [Planctomycetota bacterium]|jgi:hypothetical protein
MPGFFHLIAGHALVALAVAMFAVGSKPATCSAELPAGLIVHLDAADADPDPVAGLGGHYVLNVKGNQPPQQNLWVTSGSGKRPIV